MLAAAPPPSCSASARDAKHAVQYLLRGARARILIIHACTHAECPCQQIQLALHHHVNCNPSPIRQDHFGAEAV